MPAFFRRNLENPERRIEKEKNESSGKSKIELEIENERKRQKVLNMKENILCVK